MTVEWLHTALPVGEPVPQNQSGSEGRIRGDQPDSTAGI